jgi:hypothetical protein
MNEKQNSLLPVVTNSIMCSNGLIFSSHHTATCERTSHQPSQQKILKRNGEKRGNKLRKKETQSIVIYLCKRLICIRKKLSNICHSLVLTAAYLCDDMMACCRLPRSRRHAKDKYMSFNGEQQMLCHHRNIGLVCSLLPHP